MDYLEIYNTNFDQALKHGNAIAKQNLIALKKEKRNSNTAHNSTYQLLTDRIKENNISKYESLINLERFFKQTLSKYEENHIELALKNEITEFYNKRTKDELPENYSFLLMVEDLANYEGLKEIARLFYNQSVLYEMMYKLNDFSQFTIQPYGNIHYEDTPLFNVLRKRLYPGEKTVIKSKTLNESSSSLSTLTCLEGSQYQYETQNKTNDESVLTDEETAILIYIYNKIQHDKINVSQSQLYKCLSLINVKSAHSFNNDKSYKNSPVYKILNNKYKKADLKNLTKTDKSDIKDLIFVSQELLSKIKKQKINRIESEINEFIKEIKPIIT